jgi:hypothetical protein
MPRRSSRGAGPGSASAPRGERGEGGGEEEEKVAAEKGAAASQPALRALLALQASDWAFLADGERTGQYPSERAYGHAAEIDAALE